MKIVLLILLCFFLSFSAFSQTETEEIGIEQISLWRVGSDGKASAETEDFLTTDKPLLFRIQLKSLKAVNVKMILVALAVPGLKSKTKSVTITYTTNGKQNIVNFKASPDDIWLPGKYRADVFINGKIAGNKEFQIENSPDSKENPKPTINAKPKIVRRGRKN